MSTDDDLAARAGREKSANAVIASGRAITLQLIESSQGADMSKVHGSFTVVVAGLFAAGVLALGATPASASPGGGAGLPEFPVQCLDGSTVEFGQLCPLPSLRCADGSPMPLGGLCPAPPKQVASTAAIPTPTTAPDPELQKCREAGICSP